MANDGIVVIIANIDAKKAKLYGKINVTTRGFVLVNENEALLKDLEAISKKTILSKLHNTISFADIKTEVSNVLTSYIQEKTGRRPIILPVIMDINK